MKHGNHASALARSLAGVCLALTLGLASAAAAGEWLGTESTEDGVLHMRNPAAGMKDVATIEAEELWSIGGDTEDPDQFFGVLHRIIGDEDGNIYLLDGQLAEVKIFDADGNFVRAIGRSGEGPGEFNRPGDLFLTPQGQVAVLQRRPGRIVLLTKDGEPDGEFPLPEDGEGGFRMLFNARRAGDRVFVTSATGSFREDGMTFTTSLLGLETSGSAFATLLELTTERSRANPVIDEKLSGFNIMTWDADASGRVYVSRDYDDYRIEVYAPEGHLERVIVRDFEARQRDSKQIERMRSRFRPRGRFMANAEVIVSETDRTIQRLFPRDDGSLWVLSSRGGLDAPEGAIGSFDVFDSAGRFSRQVSLIGRGDHQRDGFFFVGERLYVVTDLYEAQRAAFGGGSDDSVEDENEDLQPVSVICYRLASELP